MPRAVHSDHAARRATERASRRAVRRSVRYARCESLESRTALHQALVTGDVGLAVRSRSAAQHRGRRALEAGKDITEVIRTFPNYKGVDTEVKFADGTRGAIRGEHIEREGGAE